jgi:hypothetical protein
VSETITTVLAEIRAGLGVNLAAVAKELPGLDGSAGRASVQTLHRWCREGCRGANGRRVVLSHVRCGSRILTSWSAVERFLSELTAPAAVGTARTPRQSRMDSELAGRELIKSRC